MLGLPRLTVEHVSHLWSAYNWEWVGLCWLGICKNSCIVYLTRPSNVHIKEITTGTQNSLHCYWIEAFCISNNPLMIVVVLVLVCEDHQLHQQHEETPKDYQIHQWFFSACVLEVYTHTCTLEANGLTWQIMSCWQLYIYFKCQVRLMLKLSYILYWLLASIWLLQLVYKKKLAASFV